MHIFISINLYSVSGIFPFCSNLPFFRHFLLSSSSPLSPPSSPFSLSPLLPPPRARISRFAAFSPVLAHYILPEQAPATFQMNLKKKIILILVDFSFFFDHQLYIVYSSLE